MKPEDTTTERPRVQVSMSMDMLSLVRHVSSVTGETDSQVVLRAIVLSLPEMVRGADEFRARLVTIKAEQEKAQQEAERRRLAQERQRVDLAGKQGGKR